MRKQKFAINTDEIKSWIRTSVDKMIEIADAQQEIASQQKLLNEVQYEIDQEMNHKASLSLLKEKILVKKYMIEGQPEDQQDKQQLFDNDHELEKIEMEINQFENNIESLSEKQDYVNTKISEISKEIVQINMDFMGSLGQQNLSSQEGIKALIDAFFQIL